MSKGISKPRKRFTQEESRAQPRATLIAVGREYFLRYGLGGAVAEKIAEDAGYLRSALHANFDGKNELFLAVIRVEQGCRMQAFHSMFKEEPSAKERLERYETRSPTLLQMAIGLCLELSLRLEFLETNVFGRPFLKYIGNKSATREISSESSRSSEIHMSIKAKEFMMIILNLAHGFAVTQKNRGAELLPNRTRRLIYALFDHLISCS